MNKSKLFLPMGLVLASITLLWYVGLAQAESISGPKSSAITGPFRSEQNVMKMRTLTNAQRQEAARKAAEYRADKARPTAANGKGNSGTAPANATVAPQSTGGINE